MGAFVSVQRSKLRRSSVAQERARSIIVGTGLAGLWTAWRLALEGRLVQIAFLKGSTAEINLLPLMVKRQTLTGSTLRPRSVAEKGVIAEALRQKVWPLLDAGTVAPIVHATFPLANAADAHRLMESSAHIGKIVLTME